MKIPPLFFIANFHLGYVIKTAGFVICGLFCLAYSKGFKF